MGLIIVLSPYGDQRGDCGSKASFTTEGEGGRILTKGSVEGGLEGALRPGVGKGNKTD